MGPRLRDDWGDAQRVPRSDITFRKAVYVPGIRVRLIRINDKHTDLQPGDQGVVGHVDDAGTIHCHWDRGSHLGIVPEAGDEVEILRETQ